MITHLIEEANELLKMAETYFTGTNYITANTYALKVYNLYQEAIECLEDLLGK